MEDVGVRGECGVAARGVAQHHADAVGRGEGGEVRRHVGGIDLPPEPIERPGEEDRRQIDAAADLDRACGRHRGPAPLPQEHVAARERAPVDRALGPEDERVRIEEAGERVELGQHGRVDAAAARGLVAPREHPLAERAEPGAIAVEEDRDPHGATSTGTSGRARRRQTCESATPASASTTSVWRSDAVQCTKSRSTLGTTWVASNTRTATTGSPTKPS